MTNGGKIKAWVTTLLMNDLMAIVWELVQTFLVLPFFKGYFSVFFFFLLVLFTLFFISTTNFIIGVCMRACVSACVCV